MKAQSAKNNHYLVAIPFGYSISDVTLRKSSQWSVLDLIVKFHHPTKHVII